MWWWIESHRMQANYSLRTHYSWAFILSEGKELSGPLASRREGAAGDPLAREENAFRSSRGLKLRGTRLAWEEATFLSDGPQPPCRQHTGEHVVMSLETWAGKVGVPSRVPRRTVRQRLLGGVGIATVSVSSLLAFPKFLRDRGDSNGISQGTLSGVR